MPKYRFVCEKCGRAIQQYVSPKTVSVVCECGHDMDRQMPTMNGPTTVHEVSDKRMGYKWLDDHQNVIQDRKLHYFWAVEVPRMVASGIYSVETMLENGWISVDDSNQVHINTKPVNTR